MSRSSATSATGTILEDAWESKILGLVMIPVVQHVLLTIAESYPKTVVTGVVGNPIAYLHSIIGILGLVAVVSTIGSVVLSYAVAQEAGILIYFVFDYLIADILNSSSIATLLLFVAVPTAVVVIYLHRIWTPRRY